MTGGGYPDGIRQITDPYFAGRHAEAVAAYQRWLPLINYENRQCGLIACKALMKEGGPSSGTTPSDFRYSRCTGRARWPDRNRETARSAGVAMGQVSR